MSSAVGFASAFGAVLLFAVFALPVKNQPTGDGIFYQFLMCCGIFSVGLVRHLTSCVATACPVFVPYVALGGFLWCTSNLFLVPVVNAIGIGRTMLLWGTVEMLAGWGTARFGLFGLTPQSVALPALNYVGVALGLVSITVLALAAPPTDAAAPDAVAPGNEFSPLLPSGNALPGKPPANGGVPGWPDWATRGYDPTVLWSSVTQFRVGIVGACIAGTLSGSMFDAPQYVADQAAAGGGEFPGASTNLLDHLFAHFTGIWITSLGYFLLYAAATRNRPWTGPPQLVLPALVAGVAWGVATLLWFVASQELSLVIAFPLVCVGPGLVSLLIGGVFYGEVTGTRSVVLLGVACFLFSGAALCIAFSTGDG